VSRNLPISSPAGKSPQRRDVSRPLPRLATRRRRFGEHSGPLSEWGQRLRRLQGARQGDFARALNAESDGAVSLPLDSSLWVALPSSFRVLVASSTSSEI